MCINYSFDSGAALPFIQMAAKQSIDYSNQSYSVKMRRQCSRCANDKKNAYSWCSTHTFRCVYVRNSHILLADMYVVTKLIPQRNFVYETAAQNSNMRHIPVASGPKLTTKTKNETW